LFCWRRRAATSCSSRQRRARVDGHVLLLPEARGRAALGELHSKGPEATPPCAHPGRVSLSRNAVEPLRDQHNRPELERAQLQKRLSKSGVDEALASATESTSNSTIHSNHAPNRSVGSPTRVRSTRRTRPLARCGANCCHAHCADSRATGGASASTARPAASRVTVRSTAARRPDEQLGGELPRVHGSPDVTGRLTASSVAGQRPRTHAR
jgi:hypothetical protein